MRSIERSAVSATPPVPLVSSPLYVADTALRKILARQAERLRPDLPSSLIDDFSLATVSAIHAAVEARFVELAQAPRVRRARADKTGY